ncbi:HK97 family phage prohead protease [Geminicoccus flavidas]|uniref:HK97 family phage prohead protease n=1 Tax=Geminicoccus flavidas TaxID=2506407 RepID=UPI00135C6786|nr:HK97 family phage prohead protease [Geminicoccus flavidas]
MDHHLLLLQGVVTTWNRWGKAVHGDPALKFRAKCLSFSGPVTFQFSHNKDIILAGNRDGSLRLWTDDHGLFCEAELPLSRRTVWLSRQIRSNIFRGMSNGCADGSDVIDRAGGWEVTRATLLEVSVAEDPRQPGTGVWIGDELDDDLPADVLAARRLWRASRRQPGISARAARQPGALVAQIDRLLALPRPVACSRAGRR